MLFEVFPDDACAAARRRFPGATVALAGEGQLCTAVAVDDLIVRYPKHAYGVERLRYEIELLETLRPHLTTAVPVVVQIELDQPVGEAFASHVALPGTTLTAERAAALSPSTRGSVAARVARFLAELHPLAGLARAHGVPERSPAQFAAELEVEVEALLADRMSTAARERAGRELAALAAVRDDTSALCHTDIGGNILFHEATGAVAIIDFGSCFITDPAFDVASLSVLGDDLLAECFNHYPALVEAQAPASAVRQTFALQDALYSARQSDWEHVDDVLRWYDTRCDATRQ